MTFEEYWHKKTIEKNDVIHNLWVAKNEPEEYALGNQLYHLLKQFARDIWEEAQKNKI